MQVYYRAVDLPDGITIERDGQMYGGIGGQDKQSSRVVLLIHIAPQVKPGEYPFAIYLEYEGKDYGTIPCQIEVIEDKQVGAAQPPSVITAKEPYAGDHGITTTRVTPQAGDKGF